MKKIGIQFVQDNRTKINIPIFFYSTIMLLAQFSIFSLF